MEEVNESNYKFYFNADNKTMVKQLKFCYKHGIRIPILGGGRHVVSLGNIKYYESLLRKEKIKKLLNDSKEEM